MATLKKILFGKYASKALNCIVEEMQKKYGQKKGRRFNYDNITYEVSRAGVVDETIEFEIFLSSFVSKHFLNFLTPSRFSLNAFGIL